MILDCDITQYYRLGCTFGRRTSAARRRDLLRSPLLHIHRLRRDLGQWPSRVAEPGSTYDPLPATEVPSQAQTRHGSEVTNIRMALRLLMRQQLT